LVDRPDSDDPVRNQYEAFPYPEPLTDLEAPARKGVVQLCDPSAYSVQLWPEGRPRRGLKILVAGCGSNQAAVIAFANRECNVIGIDLSQTSLDHEQNLKNKHSLFNLRLLRMDLGELGEMFDLIKCTGLLHHLQSPGDGLKSLVSVLSPMDVLHGMVYAANRRAGVYLLQDVFRRLGLRQNGKDIRLARDLVGFLPEHHYFHWFKRMDTTNEFANDAAFVDLLLHPRDRAYSVPEVLDLISGSGLAFQD
jgi:SAM-dependent methyltransferase